MRCDHCPAAAEVILPGSAEERSNLFLLQRGEPTRIFCLACAVAAGCFIYQSEKPKRVRAVA